MLVKLKQLTVPPGQRVLLKDITWQDFEAILTDLGESRNSRIAYENNTLEIMAPLPEDETAKVIIADLLTYSRRCAYAITEDSSAREALTAVLTEVMSDPCVYKNHNLLICNCQ